MFSYVSRVIVFVEDFSSMVDWYQKVLGLQLVYKSGAFATFKTRGALLSLHDGGKSSKDPKTANVIFDLK
ncbi:MAG: VOC family protein [Candidatus Caldarchaeum sp.]